MSIYATLWILKFPIEGDYSSDCDWIEVKAQGVPPHIGSLSPGPDTKIAIHMPLFFPLRFQWTQRVARPICEPSCS
jgi:hypothetical protein